MLDQKIKCSPVSIWKCGECRCSARESCPQPVEELDESMEVDKGSAAGPGVGTPACVGVGVDGRKRAQNGS